MKHATSERDGKEPRPHEYDAATLYKAILAAEASSGKITTRFMRSCCSSVLSARIGPLMYRRRETQNVERAIERHTIKAIAALAVFVQDRSYRIQRVHVVGNMRDVILAVIEIHASSLAKGFPKRLVVQILGLSEETILR